jgi:hypothetical protein
MNPYPVFFLLIPVAALITARVTKRRLRKERASFEHDLFT